MKINEIISEDISRRDLLKGAGLVVGGGISGYMAGESNSKDRMISYHLGILDSYIPPGEEKKLRYAIENSKSKIKIHKMSYDRGYQYGEELFSSENENNKRNLWYKLYQKLLTVEDGI
jgi:hypothetical protein